MWAGNLKGELYGARLRVLRAALDGRVDRTVIATAGDRLLHRPIGALVRAYGAPASVATRDDGQHVVFGDATANVSAIVDDDATIHAVDLRVSGRDARTRWTWTARRTRSPSARRRRSARATSSPPTPRPKASNFRVFRRNPPTRLRARLRPEDARLLDARRRRRPRDAAAARISDRSDADADAAFRSSRRRCGARAVPDGQRRRARRCCGSTSTAAAS